MADLLQILGSVEQQRRQELYNIAQPQINMLKQDIAMQEQRNLIKEEKINEIQSLGGTYKEGEDIDIQLGNVRRDRAGLDREIVAKEKYEATFGEKAPTDNIFQSFGQKAKTVKEEELKTEDKRQLETYKKAIRGEYTPEEIEKAGVDIETDPYKANAILQSKRKLAEIDRLVEKKNASLLELTTKEKENISLFKNDVEQITNVFTGLIKTKFAERNSDLLKDIKAKLDNNEPINKVQATKMINAYLDEQKVSDEDRAVLFGDYYSNVLGYNQNVGLYKEKSEELNDEGKNEDKSIDIKKYDFTKREKEFINDASNYTKGTDPDEVAIVYNNGKLKGLSNDQIEKIIKEHFGLKK